MGDRQPILPGRGTSDYARYLRTDELLALQKSPSEMTSRDELLFQTVHQSAELWMKLACFELEEATGLVTRQDLPPALRLIRRAITCVLYITDQLHILEQMSPWEYHDVRKSLGHGSGFDSPGFNQIGESTPHLAVAFQRVLEARDLDLATLYRRGREFEDLYQLAELLVEWDERIILFRSHHLKVIERIIGGHVIGTQGTPVEVLAERVDHRFFPELWKVRDELTRIADEEKS
ncbi:MAG: tryptophan 2,3-dioxygenase family protein [Dehalococcoidia bacterium]|jgi:tryptophan 2,3-dioxygenase|nr:tryptophan 2,3-dioxygenase family protein [Dehalococcoidia bacterium]